VIPHLALLLSVLAPAEAPATRDRAFRVIQISDTHVGRNAPEEDAARLRDFLRQLVTQESPVDLWAFTGDLTHKALDTQFEAFKSALDELPRGARVVLVKGNHDEGGRKVKGIAYEKILGDPTRCFDLGGYRVVTAPLLTDRGEDGAWVMDTVRGSEKPVLLFVHYYPRTEWLSLLRGTKLRAVFSGHWHGNQASRSGDVYSFNTASATLGGWDFSPPVARVIDLDGGEVRSRLVPRAPRESVKAWSFQDRILVQVVTAQDIGDQMRCAAGDLTWTLARRGVYAWESTRESSQSTGKVAEGRSGRNAATFIICTSDAWSGRTSLRDATAADVRWARPLGRMQYGGGPVVAGDRVLVATRTGLVDDRGGAVHALDLDTGDTLWSHELDGHPAGRPAADDTHGYVSTLAGTINALDLVTGATAWTFRLADHFPPMFVDHWVGTGPALHDGNLYTCYQKGPFAVDASNGALLDREEAIDGYDVLGVSPALIHGGRLFCGTFTEGLFSWTLTPSHTLEPGWRDTDVRVTAAPAADANGRLWVRTLRDLRAFDPATGEAAAAPIRLDYLQVPSAPLPIGDAVVTTGRRGRPAALTPDGAVVWTRSLGPPLATFELNHYDHPAALGDPVSTGRGIAVAGPDGLLRILDPADGSVLRAWDLGAPLASTPAADGEVVVVTDLGGTTWAVEVSGDIR